MRQEDAVENFLVDDSSSDENSDYNVLVGGSHVYNAVWWSLFICCLLGMIYCRRN